MKTAKTNQTEGVYDTFSRQEWVLWSRRPNGRWIHQVCGSWKRKKAERMAEKFVLDHGGEAICLRGHKRPKGYWEERSTKSAKKVKALS